MMRKFYLCILAFVILPTITEADWIPLNGSMAAPAPPSITVLRDNILSTEIRIDISGLELQQLLSEGKSYTSVDLLTDAFTTQAGSPEVPFVATILAIPDQSGISVEIIDSAPVQTFSGMFLPPAKPVWKEGDPEPPHMEDARAYASQDVYPTHQVTVDPPGILRDFRIARVAVYPIRYVPGKNELQVISSMTIRVSYSGGSVVNPKTTPKRAIAPSFAPIYRSSLLNYQSVLNREYDGLESGRDVMLCIMPDTFFNRFQTYAQWRHKSGTYVVTTKFSAISGANATNPDPIKNYIANAYRTWQYPPTHVLLVGDHGYVPIKLVSYDYTFANDGYFVEIEGNDFLPEMLIGRIPSKSDYSLQVVTTKIRNYERTPYTTNTDWFKRGIVTSNRAYASQIETKRWVARLMLSEGGFTQVDTLMSNNPCTMSLTTITNTINAGRSYLNYRGEGWSDGWWASCYPMKTNDVSSLNNGQMLTFVTSIGCGVAMFNATGGNCFGEQWLEIGTPTAVRGAVAFVGPTSNTHTTYNNRIDKGIYVGLMREGMDSPGQALLRGKLYMYNVFGTDPWVEYHYRVFCTLGDPATHIWKDVPRAVTINHPPTLPIGYTQSLLTVTHTATGLPVTNATICMSLDTTFTTAITDSTGQARIALTRESSGTLAITVRGGNVIPYEGNITMVQATEHVAPYGQPVVTDLDGNQDGKINPNENCQISFRLKNWGSQTANNVRASLTLSDTTYARIISQAPVSYGNLASGASATGAPLQFYVKPNCPVGYSIPLMLQINSATSSWSFREDMEVKGCNLTFKEYLVNDEGSIQTNARMDPGETVQLSMTISNTGEDIAPNARGILRSADPWITIIDSIGTFGTVGIGANASNMGDVFVVSVSAACSLRHTASYTVDLSTQNGNYPYSIQRSFSVPVGQPGTFDPTGPDSYGYYAYASDDTLYQQAPIYNWTEIRTLGTFVPRNSSGDFTVTVNLPFQFKYYGLNYSQVRVSSDGWIAFGSGTQIAYSNQRLPYNDGVNCMVAPFWDDLYSTNVADSGKLYYYYDMNNRRFIVEWDRVSHYSNYQDQETFQIILLDPAFYPTLTGDGEIIMQYQTVNEPGNCTIGIEDHTQTVGLQYVYNDSYHETATRIHDGFAIKFTTKRPTLLPRVVNIGVTLNSGWNMISNPVTRTSSTNTVRLLYPNSVFDYAFRFQPGAGYVQSSSMTNGLGYWAKFPSGQTNYISGTTRTQDTLDVIAGWNLVGSISGTVDTNRVTTIPSGIRSSGFYGFWNGYSTASQLVPGKAYWVKTTAAGKIVLKSWPYDGFPSIPQPTVVLTEALNTLVVSDNAGGLQTLYFGTDATNRISVQMYELPPPPPTGSFDARFESEGVGNLVQMLPVDFVGVKESNVCIQSISYPITLSWNIVDGGRYELTDELGGLLIPTMKIEGSGSLQITNPALTRIIFKAYGQDELPAEYALWQNYPNPFNPTTNIRFALPFRSSVQIEIYNILGQRVRTLTSQEMKAGYHILQWDGSSDFGHGVSSGMYMLRLTADGGQNNTFSAVRKLLLVR